MPDDKIRAARKKKGLCPVCGVKPDPGYVNCPKCRANQAAATARCMEGKKLGNAEALAKARLDADVMTTPQMVLSSREMAEVPAGAKIFVKAWFTTRRRLFKELQGPHRTMARAMLVILYQEEAKARGVTVKK